jgi:hypothetical protein
MGQILFALPRIGRFHLLDRLARALVARGHEVAVLTGDRVQRDFFAAQDLSVSDLAPGGAPPSGLPLDELAELEAKRRGSRAPAERRQLAARAAAVVRRFDADPPSLLFFHDVRDGLARLVHFAATRAGCRILHTGAGLLPHTMQIDVQGIDGDHSACGRSAIDYRDAPTDDALLGAALAAWIAGIAPQPLIRTPVAPPLWSSVPRLVARALLGRQGRYGSWRDGWRRPPARPPAPVALPEDPFLVLLLQDPGDARLRLDAPEPPPLGDLFAAMRRAADQLARDMPVLALAPHETIPGDLIAIARAHRIEPLPAGAAPQVVPSALACVTINHPLGAGALLAGTPVLHFGRTPWGIPGAAQRASLGSLERDLMTALDDDPRTLRERALTRLLTEDHVWCSADEPDHNGILGLVAAIERRLTHDAPSGSARAAYRAGPVWPLTPAIPPE